MFLVQIRQWCVHASKICDGFKYSTLPPHEHTQTRETMCIYFCENTDAVCTPVVTTVKHHNHKVQKGDARRGSKQPQLRGAGARNSAGHPVQEGQQRGAAVTD